MLGMHNMTVMLTIKCINSCRLPRATVAPSRQLCALFRCRVAGNAPGTCQRRTGTLPSSTQRIFAVGSAYSGSSCASSPNMLSRWRSPSQLELPKGTGSHHTAPNPVLQFGKRIRAHGSVASLEWHALRWPVRRAARLCEGYATACSMARLSLHATPCLNKAQRFYPLPPPLLH